jgi:spermidine synthase
LARVIFVFVFVASGVAALVYQTIWQRVLTLFGGADVFSVTVIVASFMAGLGFGHLAGGHVADRLTGRARVVAFAACEVAVALFALLSPWIYYDLLYVRVGGLAWSASTLAAIVFVVTLWPTFWMGMSLPLASKVLTTDARQPARWVPVLYGANTLGAAGGSVLSIAWLFPTMSFPASLGVGAAISGACAVAALALLPALTRLPPGGDLHAKPPPPGAGPTGPAPHLPWPAWLAVYALSGFVALSLEIVWFRVLGVMLKSNAYTFGSLLAIFLTGVGAGALAATTRRVARWPPVSAFLLLQAAIPLSAALSLGLLVALVNRVPLLNPVWEYFAAYEPLVRLNLRSPLYVIVHGVIPVCLILPPTLMMGLSFGCLQRAVQRDLDGLGRRVGWLQTANITGSMLGALVTGLVLLDWLGSAGTARALAALSLPFVLLHARASPSRAGRTVWAGAVAAALAIVAVPDRQTFWARLHGAEPADVTLAEDRTGVALMKARRAGTQIVLHANGTGQSWLPFSGTHTALGALPAFIHPRPERVAIIGLGAGETAFGAAGREETRIIDSIEIIRPELAVLRAFPARPRFPAVEAILADPRVRHHFTDGRAFLRRSDLRYDVIEADALRPASAYSGNLYSVEYFELVRDHLERGGLAVTWVPTRRVLRTFASVFPFVLVFRDVAVGSATEIPFDRPVVDARLTSAFAARHYARGQMDIAAQLRPYLSSDVLRFDPASDRTPLTDLNHDLWPKDEFAGGTGFFSTDSR